MFSGSIPRRGVFGLLLPLLLAVVALPAVAAAEACLECHDKAAIGKGNRSVHPPFAEDDCTACHADHGDQERLMLLETGNALCEGCHDAGGADFARSHHNIRGTKASCLSCHDPHRSSEEHLFRPGRHRPLSFGRCDPCHRYDGRLNKPTVKELCLGCHGGEEFSRRFTHTPVGKGECLACHDPHGSPEPNLLKGRYTPGRWNAGEQDYALCLQCHDRQAFTADRPEHTQFRSAGRNYHALHVVGKPGTGNAEQAGRALACRNCHEVHSAAEPRLIRRELDCGGVPCLKLDYRRTEVGGECLSGCHAPQAYSFAQRAQADEEAEVRVAPASKPERITQLEPSPLEKSINKRCVSCHEKAVRGFVRTHVHAPVRAGFCSACHLDHGPENRLILVGKEDRVCAKCHALTGDAMAAAHKGFPLAGSRCSECHDPHAGENAALLYPLRHSPFDDGDCGACHGDPAAGWKIGDRVNEVCAQCHEDVTRQPVIHTAVPKKRCVSCHRPHVAREPKLLREPRATLCFSCHDRKRFALETVHPPVQDADCAACHPAHGSANLRLLARPYPLEQFVPFAAEKYALCWECHDAASLTDPGQPAATGFNDGKRNLHALHLLDRTVASAAGSRSQAGVSCRNCHDPHATENPRLIRRVLDCNGVPCLQLEFHKAGAGGKCLGGCHDTKAYLPE
jgi:predicted CXXCH cytochrome family protein